MAKECREDIVGEDIVGGVDIDEDGDDVVVDDDKGKVVEAGSAANSVAVVSAILAAALAAIELKLELP